VPRRPSPRSKRTIFAVMRSFSVWTFKQWWHWYTAPRAPF